jgi:translation elongation factor EF-G
MPPLTIQREAAMKFGSGLRGVLLVLAVVWLAAGGCQRAYYAMWEQVGKEKRHLLRDQVDKASSDQQKASAQFKDALTRIQEIYGFEGGDLEKFYRRLSRDLEACEKRAEAVRERIGNVERIAADLFVEWEREITQISNPGLRDQSRRQLRDTQTRWARLQRAMSQAEARMEPVLRQLRDYVLYLKHNLNARAVGALQREAGGIEIEVQSLIAAIAQSVREADDFLKNFE